MIAEALVPGRRGAVAFLSSTNRDGDWILPRSFRVVAFMGNVELDLTNVRYLDSTGVSMLLDLHRALEPDGGDSRWRIAVGGACTG